MIEAIATIAAWVILSLATWGMVDLMNRLSFWGESLINKLITKGKEK
jgi:hypothetical protein